jgi:hypothetical protein
LTVRITAQMAVTMLAIVFSEICSTVHPSLVAKSLNVTSSTVIAGP